MPVPEQVSKQDNVNAGLKEILKDPVRLAFAKGRPETERTVRGPLEVLVNRAVPLRGDPFVFLKRRTCSSCGVQTETQRG
jgi:hypothetical protein